MSRSQKCTTVVGVFADRHEADKAVSDLLKAGFRQDQIGVAMRHDDGATGAETTTDGDESHAGSGAIAGVMTGLGLGTLAGLGVLAGVIPVVGPAIAAGTLGVILSNAAAGAGIVGLVGTLIGAGVPEHEANYYHDEFEAGRAIVTVTADTRATEATAILRRFGAYDMNTKDTSSANSMSTETCNTKMSNSAAPSIALARNDDTIEVKEKRLHAEKRPVETGAVTVRKEIHTETKTLEVPVQREEIVIERTPVHGRASTGVMSGNMAQGEEIRIPVREEQIHLTKDVVVTEEVKVGKRVVQDTERVSGRVRKEEVKVEETGDVNVKSRTTAKR